MLSFTDAHGTPFVIDPPALRSLTPVSSHQGNTLVDTVRTPRAGHPRESEARGGRSPRSLFRLVFEYVLRVARSPDLASAQNRARAMMHGFEQRIRDAETARLNAEQTRDLAAQAHRDVEQWVAIAEALQPDGIPGEILAEGIAPINEALDFGHQITVDMAVRSERWPLVQIAPDMSIPCDPNRSAIAA
jgi:hypothetical protein